MASFPLGGPWFRRHPSGAAVVASLLIAAVTWGAFTAGDARDATTVLYALPVTLVAMAFGRRVGTIVAVGCVGMIALWAAVDSVGLSPVGWAARVTPVLLLGVLVGAATDAFDAAARTRAQLAVTAVRQRDAAEVQDEILQRLVAAKWRVEASGVDGAADLLEDAITAGQALVQSLLADSEDPLIARPSSARGRVQVPVVAPEDDGT